MRALVVGSTGLVGRHLVRQLLAEPGVDLVRSFQRRSTGVQVGGRRAEEELVDFEALDEWSERLQGDVLFSALGTTRRAAGSQEAQYRIDHDYQVGVAQAAARNGVPVLVLVSSIGADPGARSFYMRMKGEIEEAVAKLPFERVHLLRPGILDGPRGEVRLGERMGLAVARVLARLGAPAGMRPFHADVVAGFMVECALAPSAGEVASDGANGRGEDSRGISGDHPTARRDPEEPFAQPRLAGPRVFRHEPDEILALRGAAR